MNTLGLCFPVPLCPVLVYNRRIRIIVLNREVVSFYCTQRSELSAVLIFCDPSAWNSSPLELMKLKLNSFQDILLKYFIWLL